MIPKTRYTNKEIAEQIQGIQSLMYSMKKKENKITNIIYVGNSESKEFQYYSRGKPAHAIGSTTYNFIIIFDEFEIWINHLFGYDQLSIQFNDNFKEVLSYLDVTLLDERYNKSTYKFIDKLKKKNLDEQANQYINIEY